MTRIQNVSSVHELTREDVFDSRDLIELMDKLENEKAESEEEGGPEFDEDSAELLKALQDLEGECGGEWQHGIGFIRDSYFKDYAQELAEDIGAINKEAAWPNNCIDWDQATRELQMDYSSTEIGGITYWWRE
jgi:hypothetical protein